MQGLCPWTPGKLFQLSFAELKIFPTIQTEKGKVFDLAFCRYPEFRIKLCNFFLSAFDEGEDAEASQQQGCNQADLEAGVEGYGTIFHADF